RLFNDQTINPPEANVFLLNAARTELNDPTTSLNDHISAVAAALSVAPVDLTLLIEAELSNHSLNLVNLSRLYKASTFVKSLKLTVREYVSLRALTGIDPFQSAAATWEFMDRVRLVRESGFDIPTLDYLLRHNGPFTALTEARAS